MDRPETLESFIEKLHTEGVEAGLQEAERLRAAAEAESAAALDEAREEARRVTAEAEARASAMVAGAKDEIALAARDVQLDLRARLERTLTSLLRAALERELDDADFLRKLVVEVVGAYAQADAEGQGATLEVTVRPEMVERLAAAAPGMLGGALSDGARIELRGGLDRGGFEYRVRDAVVEVTPESLAEELTRLVSAQLRDHLRSTADRSAAAAAT